MAGQIIEILIERQPLYARQHLPQTHGIRPPSWLLQLRQEKTSSALDCWVGRWVTPPSHLPQMDEIPLTTWALLTDCKHIHSCQTSASYILTRWDKTEDGPFHIPYSNSFLCISARLSARWLRPTDHCLEYCGLPALTFSHCARRGAGQ